jgi:hypothetical protein
MAMTTTTKLNAVNTMLSAVGEAPVNNLTSVNADVRMAESILEEVSREVQSQSWYFNTEKDVQLIPDSSGEINVPSPVVRVDLEGENVDADHDVVLRGSRLYNRKNNSYIFTSTLKYTTVSLMEWDYLPETAKRYIMIRAARIYQARLLGSSTRAEAVEKRRDEMEALIALRQLEMDTADYSIFDNHDVSKIIDRTAVINRVNRG